MDPKIKFRYKFKNNPSLGYLGGIEDILDFKSYFLGNPFKFKFEKNVQGLIRFVFPETSGKMAGEHAIPFSNQSSLYQILFQGIQDLYQQEKSHELTSYLGIYQLLPGQLVSLSIDTNNTIHVLISGKSKKQKFERITFMGKELKKTWKKKINLKNNLAKIFSDGDNGESGPVVYVTSNYRDDVYVVIVEAYGYSRKFKKFQSNAQDIGVRMTKIGESHNGWQDFLLEDQLSYALKDEYFTDKDYKAVEIDRTIKESLPDSLEGKEIIDTFLKLGYSIEYISEDIKLMKWPTEVHFINEKRKDFQRYRLCIHDDGMGEDETDRAIEIGSKIVEKYGYHQGVKSADSTDIFRDEHEDEWYKYLSE